MRIGRAQIVNVAELANLELSDGEIERMERDLNAVLEYMEQLNGIDTRDVEPMAHVLGERDPIEASASTLRDDEVRAWFGAEEALANAPVAAAGMFVVPRILEKT